VTPPYKSYPADYHIIYHTYRWWRNLTESGSF